ncbi:hypothetical protein PV392_00720 [Streptomyces sp. ME03-5709C]|nr:hypothetical protein [Streptomyces sp. ME03-5709C]
MARRGWRLGVTAGVAVLAAIFASGPAPTDVVRTAADLGPLPADRYRFTAQDYRRSARASALLVRQCMADRGHRDFPLDPRSPRYVVAGTAVVVGTDYGVLDPAAARRWGYGWAPARGAASPPKGRRMTSAEYADWGPCGDEANRRLTSGIALTGDWLYASERAVQVDQAVRRDPRVRAAWATWSHCMAAQGFHRYPDPVAAYTDRAWQRSGDGNTRHTPRERATALADVTCKRRHHTVELWHAVQARKQAADISRHRDHYDAGLRALRAYRADIGRVLRDLG